MSQKYAIMVQGHGLSIGQQLLVCSTVVNPMRLNNGTTNKC